MRMQDAKQEDLEHDEVIRSGVLLLASDNSYLHEMQIHLPIQLLFSMSRDLEMLQVL
jgi:hypothetical protein